MPACHRLPAQRCAASALNLAPRRRGHQAVQLRRTNVTCALDTRPAADANELAPPRCVHASCACVQTAGRPLVVVCWRETRTSTDVMLRLLSRLFASLQHPLPRPVARSRLGTQRRRRGDASGGASCAPGRRGTPMLSCGHCTCGLRRRERDASRRPDVLSSRPHRASCVCLSLSGKRRCRAVPERGHCQEQRPRHSVKWRLFRAAGVTIAAGRDAVFTERVSRGVWRSSKSRRRQRDGSAGSP